MKKVFFVMLLWGISANCFSADVIVRDKTAEIREFDSRADETFEFPCFEKMLDKEGKEVEVETRSDTYTLASLEKKKAEIQAKIDAITALKSKEV